MPSPGVAANTLLSSASVWSRSRTAPVRNEGPGLRLVSGASPSALVPLVVFRGFVNKFTCEE